LAPCSHGPAEWPPGHQKRIRARLKELYEEVVGIENHHVNFPWPSRHSPERFDDEVVKLVFKTRPYMAAWERASTNHIHLSTPREIFVKI
jgi:hypothetical protein